MALKDYLVLDMAKPINTFVNLTDYFQGRVGDAEAYCKLWVKFGSRPIDMTGKKLVFEGNDPNNTRFIDAGRFDAGDDGDVQMGMITFYFPKGIFQTEGNWQHAYFKLKTDDGKDISSADLTLHVLPNNVEMGIGIKPFESDLEKTKAQINKALKEMGAQQLLNQIDSMKSTVGAYTDLISKNQVLNKPDTVQLIKDQMSGITDKVNSQLANFQGTLSGDLKKFQSTIDSSGWRSQYLSGTLLNGCSGWTSGQYYYNNSIVFGRLIGYVEMPAMADRAIDFSTNPLSGIIDFKNATIGQVVGMIAEGKGTRPVMKCGLDDNNSKIGLWGLGDSSTAADKNLKYNFEFNMWFSGPRTMLKK